MPGHLPQALHAVVSALSASCGSANGFIGGVMAKRSMARCSRLRQRLSARGVVFRVINNEAMANEATPTFETVPDIRAPKPFNISIFPTPHLLRERWVKDRFLAMRRFVHFRGFQPIMGVNRHLLGVAPNLGH